MSIRKITVLFFLIAILSFPSYAQFPSIQQNSWHGGSNSLDFWETFGTSFLEEENTGWQSVGRLSPEYPMLNQTICNDISYGIHAEAADFTGDGFPDLVIVSYLPDSDVILLVNPGIFGIPAQEWNTVTIASSFSQCRSISSGDLDNDGDIDVVIGRYNNSGISWLENPGSSAGWLYHSVENIAGISSVDCGDIDQDGDIDILFCSVSRDTLGWMNNQDGVGESWFRETICSTVNNPFYAAITDIDSDGIPDVSACCKLSNQVYWFKKNTADDTWIQYTIASVPQAACLSAGDFNGDSFIDLLVSGLEENSVFLCTSLDGSGTAWDVKNLEINTTQTGSCLLVDLEDDGDLDIAVSDKIGNSVTILSNLDGSGQLLFETKLAAEIPMSLCPIDSDMDGTSEISCLCRCDTRILSADPTSFSMNGVLTSVVAHMPATTDNEWGNIIWDSWEPPGTTISFQLRNSNDPENMGEWSDTVTTNGTYLGDLFPDVCGYIQYRVFLNSDSPDSPPFLYSVDLEGLIGEICHDCELITEEPMVRVDCNPALTSITATINPYTDSFTELMIYDGSGRLVARRSYEPANCFIIDTIEGLSPGVYHIVSVAGQQREILKVCIIR